MNKNKTKSFVIRRVKLHTIQSELRCVSVNVILFGNDRRSLFLSATLTLVDK